MNLRYKNDKSINWDATKKSTKIQVALNWQQSYQHYQHCIYTYLIWCHILSIYGFSFGFGCSVCSCVKTHTGITSRRCWMAHSPSFAHWTFSRKIPRIIPATCIIHHFPVTFVDYCGVLTWFLPRANKIQFSLSYPWFQKTELKKLSLIYYIRYLICYIRYLHSHIRFYIAYKIS